MNLSASKIWEQQKNAYATQGVESFAKGNVPFHMTNNSRIAAQYAEIAIAAFRSQPFTVLELGGGSGKFAFLFLEELSRRGISNVRYILTDAAKNNEDFWQRHPLLKVWKEKGVLETALFDPLLEEPPLADMVIANYFFDSIPHDIYLVERGNLLEGIYSIEESAYTFSPRKENPYPDFPEAMRVMDEYREQYHCPPFLFPIGALRTIQRFPHSLFLAADRDDMKLLPTLHGSSFFSFPVNFHAIARFVELQGGEACLNNSKNDPFTVALLSKKPDSSSCLCIKQQFQKLRFGKLETKGEIVELLEESRWDATLFFSFFDRIEESSLEEKKQMLGGLRRVREQFFPLFQEEVLLLQRLSSLFQSIGEEGDAAKCLELALKLDRLHNLSFLELNPPRGELLQIGKEGIPWGSSPEKGKMFDTILLFPPKIVTRLEKPSTFLEIEKRFSLSTRVYSDADIEAFLTSQEGSDILPFFVELREKKNITSEQLELIARKLGREVPLEEDDRFFETLMLCLEHLNPRGVLRAFIPGVCHYGDARFFEKVGVDPYFETEEKWEAAGVWLTVRNLKR